MQYLCNQWSDFKNSWSCLILTLLWIQRCTMYPLHLTYTNRVKQLLWKLQFFTRDFFGNTWVIMKNGHQTHETYWLPCLGSYAWTLQDISTQAKYHRRAEESLANNMGWSATEVHQRSQSFVKRLRACVKAWGGHFGHVLKWTVFAPDFELLASCDSLKCQISMFSFDFNTSTMMKIVIFIVIVLHGSVFV